MPLGALIDSALEGLFVFVTREVNDIRHAQGLHEAIEPHGQHASPATTLAGTPTEAGTFNFDIEVTDSYAAVATLSVTLVIDDVTLSGE